MLEWNFVYKKGPVFFSPPFPPTFLGAVFASTQIFHVKNLTRCFFFFPFLPYFFFSESELKWKQLGERAMRGCHFDLAEECMQQAKDFSGLLLLATAAGKADSMEALSKTRSRG